MMILSLSMSQQKPDSQDRPETHIPSRDYERENATCESSMVYPHAVASPISSCTRLGSEVRRYFPIQSLRLGCTRGGQRPRLFLTVIGPG